MRDMGILAQASLLLEGHDKCQVVCAQSYMSIAVECVLLAPQLGSRSTEDSEQAPWSPGHGPEDTDNTE
eukprot:545507-Alexandrium_andersonii.AAC.1